MREDLKDAYKTVSEYDRHYSTVRATLGIFLFSLSYGIVAFLLKDAKASLGDPGLVFAASTIPALFLAIAFFLSCHFQRLTYACRLYMEGIEKNHSSARPHGILTIIVPQNTSKVTYTARLFPQIVSSSSTVNVIPDSPKPESWDYKASSDPEDLTQVRINLEKLINGNDSTLPTLLKELDTTEDKLPKLVAWDAPHIVLGFAFILLTFIPCLLVPLPKNSAVDQWLLGVLGIEVLVHYLPFWILGVGAFIAGVLIFKTHFKTRTGWVLSTVLVATSISWVLCFPGLSTAVDPGDKCRGGFDAIGKIWPFDPGESDDLSENADEGKLLTGFDQKNIEHCGKPIAIFLVGSTDRRVLEGKLKSVYGGNAGLARARADYIENAIKEERPSTTKEVMFVPLISGPAWHGSDKNEEEMAKDRSVSVYGLWKSKPDSGN